MEDAGAIIVHPGPSRRRDRRLENDRKDDPLFISKVLPRHCFSSPHGHRGITYPASRQVGVRAVEESASNAGALDVNVIEESLAAALGPYIPFSSRPPYVAISAAERRKSGNVRLGFMVVTNAIRLGGDYSTKP
jgi:rod shape-determining protein MreB